jgi:hypothetical protein
MLMSLQAWHGLDLAQNGLPASGQESQPKPCPMTRKFPANPPHPERNCWGCDRFCAADALICGNGSERTQHPSEMFGEDWLDWDTAATQETQVVDKRRVIPIRREG